MRAYLIRVSAEHILDQSSERRGHAVGQLGQFLLGVAGAVEPVRAIERVCTAEDLVGDGADRPDIRSAEVQRREPTRLTARDL